MKMILLSSVLLSLMICRVAYAKDTPSTPSQLSAVDNGEVINFIDVGNDDGDIILVEKGQFTCKSNEHRILYLSPDTQIGLIGCAVVDNDKHTIKGEVEGGFPIDAKLTEEKKHVEGEGVKFQL